MLRRRPQSLNQPAKRTRNEEALLACLRQRSGAGRLGEAMMYGHLDRPGETARESGRSTGAKLSEQAAPGGVPKHALHSIAAGGANSVCGGGEADGFSSWR